MLTGVNSRTTRLEVIAPERLTVVDVTQDVARVVSGTEVSDGIALIFCRHTTCGVVINEHEDGLIEDLVQAVACLVPDGYFAHDDLSRRTQNLQPNELPNGAAHVRQMLFGATLQAVPVVNGELALGTWQRILFLEFDEPRLRTLTVTLLGFQG